MKIHDVLYSVGTTYVRKKFFPQLFLWWKDYNFDFCQFKLLELYVEYNKKKFALNNCKYFTVV